MAGEDSEQTARATAQTHAWIERTSLVERSSRARVVLVEAPGGWGKSTLGDQIVEASGAAACWMRPVSDLSLDAMRSLMARGWRRAGVPDLAALVGTPDDPGSALDDLLGALNRRDEPVAMVFDDAHRLDDDAASWLRSLVDDLRRPHTLVVMARQLPRVLGRRLPRDTVRIAQADLRFGLADVAAVLGGADDDRAGAVLDATEGWPTAVGLVATGHSAADERADGPLLSSLVEDVLGDDLDALAPLALLPRLDDGVATAVAGPGSFDRIRTSGLPLRQLGESWVLADPVREVLLQRRDVTLPPEVTAAVASQYDVATAATFLAEVDALDVLASDIAARPWQELEELGVGQLVAVLEVLGPDRLRDEPRVPLAVARAIDLRDPVRTRGIIDDALSGAVADAATRHELEAERVRGLVRLADIEAAIAAAESLLDRLGAEEHAARGRALLSLGVAHAFASSPAALVRADDALGRAAGIFRLLGERAWEADALNRLAIMVSYHGGHVAAAADQQAACLALLIPGSRAWAVALTYYVEILIDLGRRAEAESAARSAFDVGRRLGDATVMSYASWSMAIVCCNAGDLEGTRRWLGEVESTPGTWLQEVSGQEFLSFGADLLGCLGDRDGAYAYRDRCVERVGRSGTQSLVDVVDGRLEAMYGDPGRAMEIFERLDGEPYATVRAKWVRCLFRALAAKRAGHRTEATSWIERSLELVSGMGLPDLPQRNEPLLVSMLADVWPGGGDAAASSTPRIMLLGGFQVVNGVEVATPAPGHPATLVKVLALRRTLTVDQAIDLLWPDADVATGRQRLRNLLNRLRSQSGNVVERDAEALRLADGVIVDVSQFDAAVDKAFDAAAQDRPGLARLALGAYTGDLLPADAYDDWAAAPRERLRRRYLSLVDIVASDALERGDLDEGVRLLDLAIEREPLEEHRYVTVAEALLALGRRSAACDVVARALRVLDDLGVAPGPDLTRVGRSLDVVRP